MALYMNGQQVGAPKPAADPSQNTNPYQGGLQTTFSGQPLGQLGTGHGVYNTSSSNDPDVQAEQALVNEDAQARAGNNDGVDYAHNAALENTYLTRIGQKNTLASQINGATGLLNQEQDLNKSVSGQAIGQGLKNTRQNYNNRGLLYSGARQGAEQSVQTQGASNLASAMTGTARDSANSLTAAQNAYAAVDLQSSQQQLDLASTAFDTANANNIARLQAMQQLGTGVGTAVGAMAGSMGRQPAVSPTTGWQPEQLQPTGLMSGSP